MFLHIHHRFFCKFHMVCTCLPPKIWWQTSVPAWSTLFDLPPKEISLQNWNNFCYKPIPNNTEFTFKGKEIITKKLFYFFRKFPLVYRIICIWWKLGLFFKVVVWMSKYWQYSILFWVKWERTNQILLTVL